MIKVKERCSRSARNRGQAVGCADAGSSSSNSSSCFEMILSFFYDFNIKLDNRTHCRQMSGTHPHPKFATDRLFSTAA